MENVVIIDDNIKVDAKILRNMTIGQISRTYNRLGRTHCLITWNFSCGKISGPVTQAHKISDSEWKTWQFSGEGEKIRFVDLDESKTAFFGLAEKE